MARPKKNVAPQPKKAKDKSIYYSSPEAASFLSNFSNLVEKFERDFEKLLFKFDKKMQKGK